MSAKSNSLLDLAYAGEGGKCQISASLATLDYSKVANVDYNRLKFQKQFTESEILYAKISRAFYPLLKGWDSPFEAASRRT